MVETSATQPLKRSQEVESWIRSVENVTRSIRNSVYIRKEDGGSCSRDLKPARGSTGWSQCQSQERAAEPDFLRSGDRLKQVATIHHFCSFHKSNTQNTEECRSRNRICLLYQEGHFARNCLFFSGRRDEEVPIPDAGPSSAREWAGKPQETDDIFAGEWT